MGMWKRITKLQKEVMRTPGPIRVQLLLLLTLTASSVTSTGLLISSRVRNTSDVNTSGQNVNLEVVREGLRLRVIGKDTTEALKNLKQIENYLGTNVSSERSYRSTQPQAAPIMQRPSNSF